MDWRGVAVEMAAMARELLARETLGSTLDQITQSCLELVEGCDASGILVLQGKKVRSLAATEQLVVESDQLQEHFGEGPCFDVARASNDDRVFRVADFTTPEPRWPRYVPAAHDLGIGSMMGFLLYTEDEDLGALNIYSRSPGAFTEASELTGWVLASHAAVAFASAREHAQLEHALATRHTIGEAMGILMGSHHLTEEEAFDKLRRYSQQHNIKLREVARRICERGHLA